MQNWTVQAGGVDNNVAYSGRDALSGQGVFFVNGAETRVSPATIDPLGLFFRLNVAGGDVVLKTDMAGNALGMAVNGVYLETGAPLEQQAAGALGALPAALAPAAGQSYAPPPGQAPVYQISPFDAEMNRQKAAIKSGFSMYSVFIYLGFFNIFSAALFNWVLSLSTMIPSFISSFSLYMSGSAKAILIALAVLVNGVFLLFAILGKKHKWAVIVSIVLVAIDTLFFAFLMFTLTLFYVFGLLTHVYMIIALVNMVKAHNKIAQMTANPHLYQTAPNAAPPVYGAAAAPAPPYSAPAPPSYNNTYQPQPAAPSYSDDVRYDPETGKPIQPPAATPSADIPRFDPETGRPLQGGLSPEMADSAAHADGDPTIQ